MDNIHDIITEINRIADAVWQEGKKLPLRDGGGEAIVTSGILKKSSSQLHDVRRRLTELYVGPATGSLAGPSPARLEDGLREWDS